jgi:hypothetical protein
MVNYLRISDVKTLHLRFRATDNRAVLSALQTFGEESNGVSEELDGATEEDEDAGEIL